MRLQGRSVVGGEARSLVGKGSTLAAIIAGAPAAALAETGTSALPGLRALLGTLPVVGLRDGAVLVVGVGGSVLGPVALPELLGVVVVLAVGGDESGAEAGGGGEASRGGGDECGNNELHGNNYNQQRINELK